MVNSLASGRIAMIKAPLPDNEAKRIEALRKYQILDTLPEQAFDDLVRLAAKICETPIALISLIDTDRQWLKSKVGWAGRASKRDVAFCAHAILSDQVFTVSDTLQDPRFVANPLVISPPYIRSYAGAQLVTPDGFTLGTLCVMDYVPRELSEAQLDILATLSRQVMALMEKGRQLRQMETTQAHLHNFLDRANVLIQSIRVSDGHFLSVNQTWRQTLGYSDEEVGQLSLLDILHPESRQPWLLEKLRHGESLESVEMIFVSKQGEPVWVEGNISCRWENGQPAVTRGIFRNITARKYRQIFENTAQGLFQVTLDGHYRTANSALARIYGYDSPEQFLESVGNINQLYVNPIHWAECIRHLETQGQVQYKTEAEVCKRDGSVIWISETIRLLRDNHGRPVAVEGFVQDITSLKQSEATLQMARDLLQVVLDAVPGTVSLISSNFRYLGVNRHLASILNLSQDALVGQEVGFRQDKFGKFVRSFFANRTSEDSIEIEGPPVDGTPRSLVVIAKKWKWLGDEAAVFVGIDITKRKQAEAALRAELAEAAEYVKSLLPSPVNEPLSIKSKFISSQQLGGDCFDYYWLDQDHLAIYLLDVSGHGLGPALLSVSVLNVLRSRSLNTNFYQPNAVLDALNEAFQMEKQRNMYFTIWYGVYNRVTRKLVYASAGHPPAVLLSNINTPSPQVQHLRTPGGLPIGMFPNVKYANAECQVEPGSTLYIYSDGIYEIKQPDGTIWSFDHFIEWLAESRRPDTLSLQHILDDLRALGSKDTFEDDVSLLQVTFD
jgi:sigma-B regulation protein RsbU (phosphoserine phosphatase)